ncbi:hypothetical protein [Micromonospora sp. CB01531]|uniref:hypothetical protein n=1 Tax=Micromonospora sp. CB01531 TaxID=1718947 RepID=UPI00093DBDE3|nr:hypothetical protein [Micromonospora sp. CB01531]OKI62273.1 hypothetical protein A6A27_04550 [Micromonospora sp. CB01531]
MSGTGTVTDNLTRALTNLVEPVVVAIVALVIARDELRTRLRTAGTARFPLVGEGAAVISAYLTAERNHGRIASDADTLAPTGPGSTGRSMVLVER